MQEHKSFTNLYIFVVTHIYTYKGMGITRKQIQLVQLLCSCIKDNKVMEDADGDGIPDFMQKGKNAFAGAGLMWAQMVLSYPQFFGKLPLYP